jgi:DNA-damage-inducible protein J
MADTTIQIRTDSEVKQAADTIFNQLGITMSDGINTFLRQVIIHRGLPYKVMLDTPEKENKIWTGHLPSVEHPKEAKNFRIYSKDEINDRHFAD